MIIVISASCKGTQETRWIEIEDRRRGGDHNRWRNHQHIERWPKRPRFLVEQIGAGRIAPVTSVDAVDERVQGRQRLRNRKRTVARAMDDDLCQKIVVAVAADPLSLCLFVL